MQAQLIKQRRDPGAFTDRLEAFGQRARVVICRGWTKRLIASMTGQPVLMPEPIGIQQFDVGFVSVLAERIEIAYIRNGKVEVEKVQRTNVLALAFMS